MKRTSFEKKKCVEEKKERNKEKATNL